MTDKPARETNVVSRSSGESGRWYSVLSPVVLLVILIVVSFYPIFMRGNGSTVWWADYTAHRAFAEEFAATNSVEILPHFAYHLVIIAVSRLFPDMPAWQHGRLPVLAAYIGIGLLIYALLMYSREVIPDRRPWWMAIIVALIMLTITPFLIVRVDLPFLLGYINPTTYHNPTQIMLKLWVIPVSLLAWRAIDPKPIVSWKRNALTLLTIALIIGMTATKPNYTLVLIPGLVVAAAYRVLRHQPVDWVPLVVGLLGPSLAMLGYQYVIAFTNPDGTSIAFGFAKIFWYFSPSSRDLILEFLERV